MNFPLRIAFPVSHRFWIFVSSFVSRYLLISSLISFLTHSLFSKMLFSPQCLSVFFISCDWFLFSYCCGNRICFILFQSFSTYQNVFVSNMWSMLGKVLCTLEKNVYSASLGWNALKIPIKSMWIVCHFRPLSPHWLSVSKIYPLKSTSC